MSNEIIAAATAGILAILGVGYGSTLNKKQRTREELYSHKVKAYAKLAELISEVRQEYEALAYIGTGSDIVPFEESKSPIEIDAYFRKNLFINILFLSPKVKDEMGAMCEKISQTSRLTFNEFTMPDLISKDDLRKSYESMINECDKQIDFLYREIGLHKL